MLQAIGFKAADELSKQIYGKSFVSIYQDQK